MAERVASVPPGGRTQLIESPEKPGRFNQEVEIEVDIEAAISAAGFGKQRITDVFWPREELYREGQAEAATSTGEDEGSDETQG